MTNSSDHASILFPNDVPAALREPDWVAAERAGAEQRLSRREQPAPDPAAAALFPSDAPKAAAPIDKDANTADKLFPDDKVEFDDQVARDFFTGFANSAIADGDVERAHALEAASEAIVADAIKAGTNAGDLSDALNIVRDRQGDMTSDEKIEADYASGMEAFRQELGEGFDADIGAARAFIRDLEIVAPGTIASLNRTGAGNDAKLVRIAIREAKRRGYGNAR